MDGRILAGAGRTGMYLGRGHGLAQLGQELTELVRRDVASACAEVMN
jgi:hypothetical protein